MTIWNYLLANLEAFVGFPLAGLAAVLIITAIYRITRHSVLLFGHVYPLDGKRASNGPSQRYQYSFFIQNIEDVSYPHRLAVRLCPPVSGVAIRRENVKVFSGPREVGFKVQEESETVEYPYVTIQFAELLPFDTWRIDCECSTTGLTLQIASEEPGPIFSTRLAKGLYPRQLHLSPVQDSRAARGPTVMPNLGIWWMLAPAMIAGYVAAVVFIGANAVSITETAFASANFWHLVWVGTLAGLLWFGFRRIQRPVYPIIQGYMADSLPKIVHPPDPPTTRETLRWGRRFKAAGGGTAKRRNRPR